MVNHKRDTTNNKQEDHDKKKATLKCPRLNAVFLTTVSQSFFSVKFLAHSGEVFNILIVKQVMFYSINYETCRLLHE